MQPEVLSPLILTIGHSTRSIEEFILPLQVHRVSTAVDARTVPGSRRNPQFNKAALAQSLNDAGMGYVHAPGLGGLRHAKRESPNMGWRNGAR
jgi:uncharacterized protein (DUF488 family)